jgi:hypothetical protein
MAKTRTAGLTAKQALGDYLKRSSSLKAEQDREYKAMVTKTARLRELRLAKEAADKETASRAAPPPRRPRAQRIKPSRPT